MMMVRSRSPAFRAVVEKREIPVFPRKVQHVNITLPDGLPNMPVHGYDKMVRENRVRIDENVIFLPFPAFKLHHYLLIGAVLTAKEAFSGPDVSLVQLCG